MLLFLFGINTNVNAQCVSGDCIDGHGTFKWLSGATYTGEFVNGNRTGYGKYTFSNGDNYIGEWQNNERHGYGAYTYNDNSGYKSYAGEWQNNNRSGMGIIFYNDEKVKNRFGLWEANTFIHKYEKIGCLSGDCINNEGTYVWNDGGRYHGTFKNGKRIGEGVHYYPKGAKYVGTQVDGKRNGQGTYYYINGDKFVGEWKDDLRIKGILYTNGEKKLL